ncbi:FtsK/SpoIIIE domain-containing protein [Streptomyces avicenniae]|uniref:FtsK/SpoIIIE domain-containing protein n=1 Tax=Streptomyces avicenniae TaxID=500153 RepID=UPI000699E90E|nr:FtsK/SpoIIIE domain-containing protein [Streptomyces avicenniae]
MKLTVTTADAQGRLRDHLLDLPHDATVADLSTALTTPRLYLDGDLLDSDAPLGAGGVRDGALLGLGAPAPPRAAPDRAWRPPASDPELVEIRHVSGPGAGSVWRLGPGRHEVGTDRGCVVRLAPEGEGGTPPHGTWVTVGTDGTVTFRLPEDADPARCGLRSLTPPPPVDPETGTPLTDEEPAGRQDGGPGGHSTDPPPPGPDGLPARPPLPAPGVTPPPDDGSLPWPPWADLALGDHLLRVTPPFEPDAAVNPAAEGPAIEYNRPPRITPHLDAEDLQLPGPPSPAGARPFPFLLMVAPLIMGFVMMSLFRTFYFVIFIFFTPLMALGNWLTGRRTGRKRQEELVRLYRLRRSALEAEMRRASVEERTLRGATFPDPAAALLTATGPGHQLWERRRHHPDYLTLRLGTVTRASLKEITDAAREANHRSVHWRLADVPIGAELPELGVVGITGQGPVPRAVARWAVAQAAVLHSPRDLRIVVLTDAEHADDWSWTRWLPHLRPGRSAAAGAPVISLGNDPESTAHRVSELLAEINTRGAATGSALGRTLNTEPDVLLVLDGARRLRDVPGIVQVLTEGPAVRIFSLCLDERERLLPEECAAVITAVGNTLTIRSSGVPAVTGVRADQVDPAWCDTLARALAPLRDVSVDAESGLPAEVRLLPLLGQEPPDPEALVRAWARRPASTTFTVGAGYEGPLRLDLVRDGPHGLIGGTTGSGKSELLQTMIASLAAVNRPDELTFVLVDYKGGSAFRECADLPHTLGMITDLDGHLVERALASLAAELRRREQVLADVEVKDHREYRARRAREPELPPLPRLLLVIDEFATLVRELPEFVPGLISLAQRGRSLGLHLILATQRPAGAVSNEIRANTNLRVALRVTDRTESQDILNSSEATGISPSTPGRALIRRGDGPPTPFQSAWAGAERPGAARDTEGAARVVRGTELTWQRLGRPLPAPDEQERAEEESSPVEKDAAEAEERPTDLRVLVDAIREAAALLPDFTPQPRPWLPALDTGLRLDDLPPSPEPEPGHLPVVPYAVLDLPHSQEQRVGVLDLATFGHLYVIGAPRTGRTQVLRTLAGSAALHLTTDQLHVHGIDAAGAGLSVLDALPHTGSIVSRHDTERLDRLVARLLTELTHRQQLIARHDTTGLAGLRAKLPAAERPAHILLLIDGWDALTEALDKYDGARVNEELMRLLREGAAVGIHLIATSERALLGSRTAAHNDRRLMLRQADPADYAIAGVSRKLVPPHMPAGRGFLTPGAVEAQIALLPEEGAGRGDQSDALRGIGRRTTARDADVPAAARPFRVGELPTAVGFQEAAQRMPDALRRPLWALYGVGGDAEPHGFDFHADAGAFVVAGPPRSGRTTALASMSVSLLMGGTALVVLTPRDSQLRRLAAHGLAQVIAHPDPTPDLLNEALAAVEGRPVVVVVDDADLLQTSKADPVLRRIASEGRDHGQGLLLAGPAEALGILGWIGVARRARRGLLLGPRNLGEGDLIGARLSGEHLRAPAAPGRAWAAGASGRPVAVQVPFTVLDG